MPACLPDVDMHAAIDLLSGLSDDHDEADDILLDGYGFRWLLWERPSSG